MKAVWQVTENMEIRTCDCKHGAHSSEQAVSDSHFKETQMFHRGTDDADYLAL